MSAVSVAGLPAAAMAGAATGARSFTALAAVVDTIPSNATGQPERALSHPVVKGLLTLLAAQEWVLDKLPNTPSRLEILGICTRLAGAAGAGALLARRAAVAEAVLVPGEPGPAGSAGGPAGSGDAAHRPVSGDPAADLRVPLAGAAVAAAAAAGAAWLGAQFRGVCDSAFGHDWPAAALEDAASLGLAARRRPDELSDAADRGRGHPDDGVLNDATVERTDTAIEVRSSTTVAPAQLFSVLTDPAGHVRIDGSGTVRADVDASPIERVGQVFTMAMHHDLLGDYRTENHVVEFEADRVIAWTTGRAGQPPAGVVWSWRFAPTEDGQTAITHRYDWSGVTDPAVLARVTFPRVSAAQLVGTVQRLAEIANERA